MHDGRCWWYAVALLLLAALTVGCTGGGEPTAQTGQGTLPPLIPTATPTQTASSAPSPTPPPEPALELIARHPLGNRGFNGDVWAHEGHAYVGSWGGAAGAPCPRPGVAVVSLARPERPRRVSTLRPPRGTTGEDVVVVAVDTPSFTGDVAVVGIQRCSQHPRGFRGFEIWNVTRPAQPRRLGRWHAPADTVGCHEVDAVVRRNGRVLVGCANLFASSHNQDEAVFVDVTDPRRPRRVGGFTANFNHSRGVGCLDFRAVHNVRFAEQGRQAYLSYFDAGTMLIDISRPGKPTKIRGVERRPKEDGDNHSVGLGPGGLVVINHEDVSPAHRSARFGDCEQRSGGWGGISVWDWSHPEKPRRLGEFFTKHSRGTRSKTPDVFSVHNTEVVGDQAFASWYSDGVRWLDLSNPRHPRLVAKYVPPKRRDPRGFFRKSTLVWGVFPMPEEGLVLASDINGGLYVLRAVGLG